MYDKILYELKPKFMLQNKFVLYLFCMFILVNFLFFVLERGLSIPFIFDKYTFLFIFLFAFVVSFLEYKKYEDCIYRCYKNRIEIDTGSKIVNIKYSAIEKAEVTSSIFFFNKSVEHIKITPIMQQGRLNLWMFKIRKFSYYLHYIQHANAFCSEINKLREEYISGEDSKK